jgi:hypothetical protein
MSLREVAEQALKHLDSVSDWDTTYPIGKAKEALRQALAQPNKEWVGLTDQEIWDLGADHAIDLAWAREIEAKLKEKNV